MSAPADTGSLAGPSTPSAPAPSNGSSSSSAAPSTERARIDPHTTWEQLRARQNGGPAESHVDEPQLTPDKLQAWLDEQRAENGEGEADPERGSATAHTARATDDVQKLAAEASKAKPEPSPEPEPAKAEPEQAKAPRTFKVKVKGEEIAVPLDKYAALVKLAPETVEYIAEHEGEHAAAQLYQRLHRGDEDARAHGTLRREVERMFAGMKSNPVDVLEYLSRRDDVGFDLLDVAYQVVQRDIDLKAMTPEARRLREVEQQLAQMQAREQAHNAERERVLREAQATAQRNFLETFRREYGEEIGGALTDAGLPVDDYHRGLVESALKAEMNRKGEAYTRPEGRAEMRARAAAHIPAVREQLRAAIKALYGHPDPETVQAFIADLPELHQAAAKERVAAYKKNAAAQVNGKGADNRGTANTPKISEQWRDDLRRRA